MEYCTPGGGQKKGAQWGRITGTQDPHPRRAPSAFSVHVCRSDCLRFGVATVMLGSEKRKTHQFGGCLVLYPYPIVN